MSKRNAIGTFLSGMLLAIPFFAHAQTLRITPSLIDSARSVEQALEESESHASTTIEGEGKVVQLTYQSSKPLDVFMGPTEAGNGYTPTDYIRFILPQTENGTVAIDLTVSPGWSPAPQRWIVTLLGKEKDSDAAFSDIRFTNDDARSVARIAAGHLFTEEFYTPSSVHALRGYRIFGVSVTMVLGILVLCASGACFLFVPKRHRTSSVMLTLMIGGLLYQGRFSIDLLRFSLQHAAEYASGTYDEAGSIHAVAENLRELRKSEKTTLVYVCRDGTNFKEKLLRYFTYPMRISSEAETAATADYAVVMNKFKWGFETTVTKEASNVRLKCGDLDRDAKRLNTFPGGEILFLLPASKPPSSPE